MDGIISICSKSSVHIYTPSLESQELFRVKWILLQQADLQHSESDPHSPVINFIQALTSNSFVKSCAITLPGYLCNLHQVILCSNGSLLILQEENSYIPSTFNFSFGKLIGNGYKVVVDLSSHVGSVYSCFTYISSPDNCLLISSTSLSILIWKLYLDMSGKTCTDCLGKFDLEQTDSGSIDHIAASFVTINSFVVSYFCGKSGNLANLSFSIDFSGKLNLNEKSNITLENCGINYMMTYDRGLILISNDESFLLKYDSNDVTSLSTIKLNVNSTITGAVCRPDLRSMLFSSLDGSLILKNVVNDVCNEVRNDHSINLSSIVSPIYGLACDPLFQIAFFTTLKTPEVESTREAQLNYSLTKPNILISWIDFSKELDCIRPEDISSTLFKLFMAAYSLSSENPMASLFSLPMVLSKKFDTWRKFFRSLVMKPLSEKIQEGIQLTQLADSTIKKKRKFVGINATDIEDISDDSSSSDVEEFKGSNLKDNGDDNTNFMQATIYNKLANFVDPSLAQIAEIVFGYILDAIFNLNSVLLGDGDRAGSTNNIAKLDIILEFPIGKMLLSNYVMKLHEFGIFFSKNERYLCTKEESRIMENILFIVSLAQPNSKLQRN